MDDDRDLFLLLCSGLLETYCSQVVFDGVRFGVTASVVPSRGTGPRIVLDFSETEFETAIVVTEESAQSLWPDRPPRRRSVQLMLVHADEDIATTPAAPDAYVMTLPDGHVSSAPCRRRRLRPEPLHVGSLRIKPPTVLACAASSTKANAMVTASSRADHLGRRPSRALGLLLFRPRSPVSHPGPVVSAGSGGAS